STTAQRILLSLVPLDVELHRGAGVVVQAADQAMVDLIADAQGLELVADLLEVGPAGVTQVVNGAWRGRGDVRVQVLVVEHTQRVEPQAPPRILRQAVAQRSEV